MCIYLSWIASIQVIWKNYTKQDTKKETDAVMALALATYLVERTQGRLGNDRRIITTSLAA